MTSNISFTSLVTSKLKQHMWLPVLLTIGMFFTVLLPVWLANREPDIIKFNYLIPLGALFFSFITPFILFQYILKKTQVDFLHSLPVKRGKLFGANFVTGLFQLYIPFTIMYLLACLSTTEFSDAYLECYLTIIINSFTIYAFSTLSIIIAGNLLMSVLLGVVLNGFILMAYYATFFLLDMLLLSFNYSSLPVEYFKFAQYTTPIANYINYYDSELSWNFISIILFGLIAITMAYFLYKIRPSENASQAIAIPQFRPFIKYACIYVASIFIGCLFLVMTAQFIWLIIGIICSVITINGILEVIFEGDFKACFRNIKYNAIFIALIIGVVLVLRYDVIQYDRKLPASDEIVKITWSTAPDYLENKIIYTSQEDVVQSLGLTEDLIAHLYDHRSYTEWSYNDITITYYLEDDSTYSRTYDLTNLYDDNRTLYDQYIQMQSSLNAVFTYNNYEDLDSYKSTMRSFYIIYSEKPSYTVTLQNDTDNTIFEGMLDLIAKESQLLTQEYLDQNNVPEITLSLCSNDYKYYTLNIYPCFSGTLAYMNYYYNDFDDFSGVEYYETEEIILN